MFKKIINSLKSKGVFTGQFFGDKDEWSKKENMTFHSEKAAKSLLSDLNIIEFQEEEKDGTIANGQPKHWHVFHFIVKK